MIFDSEGHCVPSFNISDEDRELIIRAVEAARNHPKLIDGIWWVWDFDMRGYVSTGQIGSITGNIGGDKNYYHSQGVAAEEWVIEHNLGKYPSVTVVSSAGEEIYCDKKFLSADIVVLNFGTPISGAAFLN